MNCEQFYCIYSGREHPIEARSLEHIVPYSIGGPGEFGTYDISKQANSDAGTYVDAPLINHPLITVHRWRLGLQSQGRVVPGIEFRGTINMNGKTVQARYSIHPDGSCKLISVPQVQTDWDTGNIRINCDAGEFPSILENIARRATRRGIELNIEEVTQKATATRIEHPTINTELGIGIFDLVPGFVKMALGTGHILAGETWSRSPAAQLLRDVINERDPEKRNAVLLHGQVWPNLTGDHAARRKLCFIDEDKHVGYVQLNDSPWTHTDLKPGQGRVFVVCCRTRRVTSFDWEQFVTSQLMENGRL